MVIKATFPDPCPDCGALISCCVTSMERLATADALKILVDRQTEDVRHLKAMTKDRDTWREAAIKEQARGNELGRQLEELRAAIKALHT